MNIIPGKIADITNSGEIHLVDIDIGKGDSIASTILETTDDMRLVVGQKVKVYFKAMEVSVAKDLQGMISLHNRFPSTIKAIKKGKVLCQITLDYNGRKIVSVITTRSAERIGVAEGESVLGLIKASEIIVVEENHAI